MKDTHVNIQKRWWDNIIPNDLLSKNDLTHKIINDKALIINADSFHLLKSIPDNSIHAVVTDPPYGVKEYDLEELDKMKKGNGGIWRLPPSYDGTVRSPLPRFTALSEKERDRLKQYFSELGNLLGDKLLPGGHLFIASNSFMSLCVFSAITNKNLEYRGDVIRLVRTLRGGDKPKNYETEFPDVCSLARGCYEPWGIFRKPLPAKMTIGECLKKYSTGGIRRISEDKPFEDVIFDGRTPMLERKIVNHPSLKPQKFMRQIVHSALPMGEGVILDPFMGGGSTIAAALALGYNSIGIERDIEYYQTGGDAIEKLKNIDF